MPRPNSCSVLIKLRLSIHLGWPLCTSGACLEPHCSCMLCATFRAARKKQSLLTLANLGCMATTIGSASNPHSRLNSLLTPELLELKSWAHPTPGSLHTGVVN